MRCSVLLAALTVATCTANFDAEADPPDGYGIVGDAAIAAYPAKALAARTAGQAIITCERDAGGKAHDCRINSEAPSGLGFGAAALKLISEAPAEGEMEPAQRKRLPFHFLFRADPPTITPDVFHPAQQTPYIVQAPSDEESNRAVMGMPLSGPSAVLIDCWIGDVGFLTDCKLRSETPPGTGMGALEIKLLTLDRFASSTEEGFPATGMKVTVDTGSTTENAGTGGGAGK